MIHKKILHLIMRNKLEAINGCEGEIQYEPLHDLWILLNS